MICPEPRFFTWYEGPNEMNAISTRNVIAESGGTHVVGRVGLHALGMFAVDQRDSVASDLNDVRDSVHSLCSSLEALIGASSELLLISLVVSRLASSGRDCTRHTDSPVKVHWRSNNYSSARCSLNAT